MAEEGTLEMQRANVNAEGTQRTVNNVKSSQEEYLDPPPSLAPDASSSNDNKDDLLKQRTTLNINNRNVRLTLWSMIYIVITTTVIIDASFFHIHYSHDIDDADSSVHDRVNYYNWLISSTNVIHFGGLLFLAILLFPCCVCARELIGKAINASLFVIGGFLPIAPLTTGILRLLHYVQLSLFVHRNMCP